MHIKKVSDISIDSFNVNVSLKVVKLEAHVLLSGVLGYTGGHLCKYVNIYLLTGISENEDLPTHEFPVSTGDFDTKW